MLANVRRQSPRPLNSFAFRHRHVIAALTRREIASLGIYGVAALVVYVLGTMLFARLRPGFADVM